MNEDKQNLSFEISPEVAKGNYSNLAIITHSNCEFILDFASRLPGMPKSQVVSRMIMNPEHAKRLLLALKDNIQKYEEHFGEIKLDMGPKNTFPMGGFGNGGARS